MKIVFLIVLSINLFANNSLTDYRINGIYAIEKKMDFELTNIKYWDEYIKNIDTTFGYIESYENILTCDKKRSTLKLYSKNNTDTYSFIKEYSAFTGKMEGDKLKEGDLKTPLGIYTITKKLSKENNLDSFYGPLAFVTSYPNSYDKYRGKNGHGIWIHGLPTKKKRDEFTKGCIAINNDNIECLDKNIDVDKTLILISNSKLRKNTSKVILTSLLSQLYSWRYAWIYNDINNYLNFYSNKFVRFDNMKINNFKRYKKRVFSKNETKTIIFNNINIVPYPNKKNIYQITFEEFYKSDTFKFIGNKTLIVEIDINNKMQIITEK